mmetsp:Transcript_39578/g.96245  ORF Transcript_39578/g.96245 Transcript_39578/m.96245 type:complete len:261 (-) Transcript_39578:672-1454(-)
MNLKAMVVYSRSATTSTLLSPACLALGCNTKYSSVVPLGRPRSRMPFAYSFSEVPWCRMYCRSSNTCLASPASSLPSNLATSSLTSSSTPSTSRARRSLYSFRASAWSAPTHIRASRPLAASAGCPVFKAHTSSNFDRGLPPTDRPWDPAVCISTLLSSSLSRLWLAATVFRLRTSRIAATTTATTAATTRKAMTISDTSTAVPDPEQIEDTAQEVHAEAPPDMAYVPAGQAAQVLDDVAPLAADEVPAPQALHSASLQP